MVVLMEAAFLDIAAWLAFAACSKGSADKVGILVEGSSFGATDIV